MPGATKKARASLAGKTTPSKVAVVADEDEVDERFAAAKTMPMDDRDGDGGEESDDVSDGGESEDEEAAAEDVSGGLSGFAGKRDQKEKGQDKLWADPTHAEMKGLKESELHFKSSLLRLQMDELKAQVSVNYTKTTGLESWLHTFKGVLEALPAATLSTTSLGEETVLEKMEFRAPTAVHMVGSYLLRTVARPDLTVDLVVEMPADILHHKDFLNRKYLDKRQLYLEHIAHKLRSHQSVAAVSFSAFRGDAAKPCVLIKPAGLSGLSGKFNVRLLAAPPADLFPLARFRPSRNNVRVAGVTDIALQPPTPTYNTAVVEDLRMVHHLELLHSEFAQCSALAETATLLKVWLRQRALNTASDSFNGFSISMLLLYLVQKRTISRSMSCYHMLRATYIFLSKKETLEAGLHLAPNAEFFLAAIATPAEALAEFVGGGQAVLLDDSLAVNLLARVSASALSEIQHEARAALLCLEQDANNGFTPLMLQKVSVACKYDELLVIRAAEDPDHAAQRPGGGSWEDSDEILGEAEPGVPQAVVVARRALRVVEEALGERLHFARVLSREAIETPLPTAADAAAAERAKRGASGASASLDSVLAKKAWGPGAEIIIGLLLNSDCAGRKVERGPPAEEADASRRFRKFWGSKSELRRFKDGAIQETLVWSEVR